MGNTQIKQVSVHKHLGLILSETLSWKEHITSICHKANKRIGCLKRLSSLLARKSKVTIYVSYIRPILEYAAVIYDGCPIYLVDKLEAVQRQAALLCTRAYLRTSHVLLLSEVGWERLSLRRECQKLFYFFQDVTRTGTTLSCEFNS